MSDNEKESNKFLAEQYMSSMGVSTKDPIELAREIAAEYTMKAKKGEPIFEEWLGPMQEHMKNQRDFILCAGYLIHYTSDVEIGTERENSDFSQAFVYGLKANENSGDGWSESLVRGGLKQHPKALKRDLDEKFELIRSGEGTYESFEKDFLWAIADAEHDSHAQSYMLRSFEIGSRQLAQEFENDNGYNL